MNQDQTLTFEEKIDINNKMVMDMAPQLEMPFVPKGWGYEVWIHNDEKYCGKLLYIAKGRALSWHYHEKKTETFFVESGSIEVLISKFDDINTAMAYYLGAGDKLEIEPYTRHKVTAVKDTRLFEFSTQHFDEDSVRVIKGDSLPKEQTIKDTFITS